MLHLRLGKLLHLALNFITFTVGITFRLICVTFTVGITFSVVITFSGDTSVRSRWRNIGQVLSFFSCLGP